MIGQRCSHHCQITASDLHGALLEVGFECLVGVFVQNAEVSQEPADGTITMACLAFTFIDGPVDLEVSPGEAAQIFHDPVNAAFVILLQ